MRRSICQLSGGRLASQFPSFEASPFLSDASLTVTYLSWAGLWVAVALGLAGLAFHRRDL
jgi:hypothetical protein